MDKEIAMKIDFERFKGTLPYASELFGIYQPLLGWKSRMTEDRMARSQDSVIRSFSERVISRTRSDVNVQLVSGGFTVTNLAVLDVISTHFVPRVGRKIDSIIARVMAGQLPVDRKPTADQWRTLLDRELLNKELQRSQDRVERYLAQNTTNIPPDVLTYIQKAADRLRWRDASTPQILKALLDREVAICTYLHWLSRNKPEVLDTLFYRNVTDPFADILVYDKDPLSTLGAHGLQAVLSPIGLVHLFRQYFFEFDTFLGPPVGHIWLSPGSTLERIFPLHFGERRTISEGYLHFCPIM